MFGRVRAIGRVWRAGYDMVAPSGEGGQRCMTGALDMADQIGGVKEVDYVNTHGTSTPVGDVKELGGIKEVFTKRGYVLRRRHPRCCATSESVARGAAAAAAAAAAAQRLRGGGRGWWWWWSESATPAGLPAFLRVWW